VFYCLRPVIKCQRLFAARFSVLSVCNCCKHSGYNFPFLLSEKFT
jgi:hypothetical protein